MKRSGLSKGVLVGMLLTVMLLAVASARAASLPGDSEAAAHGDEAASVQLVKETEQKSADFVFRQYNLAVLSHYSYLIGSGGEAMIIDPARDVGRYLKDAQELGLKITRVYLTHSHADFVAGHMELAKATGAEIIVNEATKAGFPHKPVKDGGCHRLRQSTRGHRDDSGAHPRRHLPLRVSSSLRDEPGVRPHRRHFVHRQRRSSRPDGRCHERSRTGRNGLSLLEGQTVRTARRHEVLPGSRGGLALRCTLERQARLHDRRAAQGEHLSAT